jgi:hypothetical protein
MMKIDDDGGGRAGQTEMQAGGDLVADVRRPRAMSRHLDHRGGRVAGDRHRYSATIGHGVNPIDRLATSDE